MARTTIASRIIAAKTAQGFEYVGMTSGWYSFRKGSNLRSFLDRNNLTEFDVDVEIGARAGMHRNDGNQLLVFRNPATA
jgi:hypothetical protein